MRYLYILTIFCAALFISSCSGKRSAYPKLLILIPQKSAADSTLSSVLAVCKKNNLAADTTSNAAAINEDTLRVYAAVVFMNGAGSLLNHYQKADFERYIQAGGGYAQLMLSADTVVNWPWLNTLTYGFNKKNITPAVKQIDPGLRTAEYDGGRMASLLYTHKDTTLFTEKEKEQLLEALQYAIGKNTAPVYSKCVTLRVPPEMRFSKQLLTNALNQPVQFTVLPDGSILIAQHAGDIAYYNPSDKSLTQVMHLDVYHTLSDHEHTGDVEMGLMGLHHDPDFEHNHWIYLYYSVLDKSVDRLSRFTFINKKIDPSSEQVVLEVPTERYYPMAHTGGGMAFDAAGNLYLSTGDNTNPFFLWDTITGRNHPYNVNGFAPMDDRPLYTHSDDRRAAGNSNDLRGKILRIRVTKNGGYTIPAGNLFDEHEQKARPEIYTMGNRNPYRISVDQHTGFLYWGEVGPDSYDDSLETRGPKGYDEINQAKQAGNFGYPYFVGNNYAYREYDYATGKSGNAFDPQHVINNSRNNTGLRELPPAQPAFIWYPYDVSKAFPILGQGGRTAMAGPVYYTNDYPAATRFPDYYNGKLFIYEWTRNWIMAVTMNADGSLNNIEPFMAGTKFNAPVDMKAGPDGKMYILDYGTGWYTNNTDAGLYVVEYNAGNLPPVASLTSNVTEGSLPLTVKLSAKGSYDPDGKIIKYIWHFNTGENKETTTAEAEYTFTKPGLYTITADVVDNMGTVTTALPVTVLAGNSSPKVAIRVDGNPVFYFPGRPIRYSISAADKEDSASGKMPELMKNSKVKADYLEGMDKIISAINETEKKPAPGETMMLSLDCKGCHKKEEKSIGPAFLQVSDKYWKRPDAASYLSGKIIKGSSGVWNASLSMPAHPALSFADAKNIADWILSLHTEKQPVSLPSTGIIDLRKYSLTDKGVVYIQASATDAGVAALSPLTGYKTLTLRSPFLPANEATATMGFAPLKENTGNGNAPEKEESWLMYDSISIKTVRAVEVQYTYDKTGAGEKQLWEITMRLDNKNGLLVGKTITSANNIIIPVSANLTTDDRLHAVYFIFRKLNNGPSSLLVEGFRLKP